MGVRQCSSFWDPCRRAACAGNLFRPPALGSGGRPTNPSHSPSTRLANTALDTTPHALRMVMIGSPTGSLRWRLHLVALLLRCGTGTKRAPTLAWLLICLPPFGSRSEPNQKSKIGSGQGRENRLTDHLQILGKGTTPRRPAGQLHRGKEAEFHLFITVVEV